MRRPWYARASVLFNLVAFVVAVGGCRSRPGPTGPMMGGPRGTQAPSTFTSNGERIYYTATSQYGDSITFTGGPMWLQMHGGSCVSCHGPGGKGGVAVPMSNVVAPDIRYSTLTKPMRHDGKEQPAYTDALIKRAITRGLDSAGKPLNSAMPRWNMADRDLNELLTYLKSLNGR